MTGNLSDAVESRIKRSNQTWKHTHRKIPPDQAFTPKVKIVLRNPLIRSTMIYGLRSRDLPRRLRDKMETYMYKHLRQMINPRWKID